MVNGSFDRTIAGIRMLAAGNIKVSLKTMIMTANIHEFDGMLALAQDFGVKFRADPELFPALDGDRSPIDLRVDPAAAVEMEMKLPGRKKDWQDFLERMKHVPSDNCLYECAAGMSYFHISSEGLLRPCLMTTDIGIDLTQNSFQHAWSDLIPELFKRSAPEGFKCASCPSRTACDSCPSFFMLENGSKTDYSSYICNIAAERLKHVRGGTTNEERE
jgi:radical SAM protein with 4Fe4S-binding SPASM domain